MKKHLLVILFLHTSIIALGQSGITSDDWKAIKSKNFDTLLNDLKIDFEVPDGFSEIPVVENEHVIYNKSYKHDSLGFEFRIWIRDVRDQIKPKELTDDQFSKSFMTMVVMNTSGYILPNIPQMTTIDQLISNKEFNADWVSTSVFLPNKNKFNDGFDICSVIGMRKTGLAEVYVFFMVTDREKEKFLVSDLVQVVTFK